MTAAFIDLLKRGRDNKCYIKVARLFGELEQETHAEPARELLHAFAGWIKPTFGAEIIRDPGRQVLQTVALPWWQTRF